MIHRLCIACHKYLPHEHTVHPSLRYAPGVVEHTVIESRIIIKATTYLFYCLGVFLISCLFVHKEDCIAGHEVIQVTGPESYHISILLYVLVYILLYVIEIQWITCLFPQILHSEHHISGLPGKRSITAKPMNCIRIGITFYESLSGTLGEIRLSHRHQRQQRSQQNK